MKPILKHSRFRFGSKAQMIAACSFVWFGSQFLSEPAFAGPLTIGPDYQPPANSAPAQYKAAELGSWKEGRPLDQLPKGNCWEVFGDGGLDQLEAQAARENQNLKA